MPKVRPGRPAESRFPPIEPDQFPVEILLPRLRRVSGHDPTWLALCPAHADNRPSLSVTEEPGGMLLIHCHAGCEPKEVVEAVGLDLSHLYPSPFVQCFGGRQTLQHRQITPALPDGRIEEPEIDRDRFEGLLRRFPCSRRKMARLADLLGLQAKSLRALGVGYTNGRWIFPEMDASRRVVGLIYRTAEGQKRSLTGGKRGLSIPDDIDDLGQDTIMLPEGASDTAALYGVGVAAVGRPSATGTRLAHQWLCDFLRDRPGPDLVVVADRNADGVGVRGASALARLLREALGRPVNCAMPAPPYEDVREQIISGHWYKGLVYFREDA